MLNLALAFLIVHTVSPPKTHRVVIEVNVPGETAYRTVLGNAEHLKKAFAPEPVEIEIVCEGNGIDMVLSDRTRLAKRIAEDAGNGVQFAACGNTVKGLHIDRKRLYRFVRVVDAGVAEIVRKQEAGWSYLKGAY
ncbi:MAG: DsrE family protein [Fimbriimonas sp.]|nr:DsrE family protein [Fimbriimonas sp.]